MGDYAIPILPSRDQEKTISFYGRLGFRVVRQYEGRDPYLIMRRGDIELHFFGWVDTDPWASIAGCYLHVDDLEEWLEAFAQADLPEEGIPRLSRPVDTDYGMREFALVDLDGNLLRIGEAFST